MPECPVCLLAFDTSVRAPMLLECEHSLCLACVKNMLAPLTCPLCREVTSGSVTDLKENPELFPKRDSCVECEAHASCFCASCGPLCEPCSSKIHSFKSFSSHVIVPVSAKASVIPYCEEHDKEAELYCPADASLICVDCRDVGTHKGHHNLMSLHEAAVMKTGELQSVIERVNATQKLEHLVNAIMQARENATSKFNAARARLEVFAARTRQVHSEIDDEEQKLNAAFDQQVQELMRARDMLLDVKAQALKVCEGNKTQILRAPEVAFPQIDVLGGPCFVLRKCLLVLPDISDMKVEFFSDTITSRASIEDVLAQRDFMTEQRVDVLDMNSVNDSWRTAVIVDIDDNDKCLIHYENWGPEYDEWIPRDSFRIATLGTNTMGRFTGDPKKQGAKNGQKV